jgi:hypothetical protein
LFQIAVEAVLSDDKIQRRMRDDPRFALLAVDAVYYAPRQLSSRSPPRKETLGELRIQPRETRRAS